MQTLRPLGRTGIRVSPIAMGCWPMAGMTSPDANRPDSLATIRACRDVGVNFFDTAYCYGAAGESELLLGEALADCRDDVVIATKGGLHWGPDGRQVRDGSPGRLRAQCEESLRRLRTDYVDLYYLHAPDPQTPLEESAAALRQLLDEGKTRSVGVSNVTLEQLQRFAAICPVSAVQPPYNMLMRDIERDLLPWCLEHEVAVCVYWPLMKGLLAGRLARNHRFAAGDGRLKYPMFQGEEWQRNHDLLDALRRVAEAAGRTLAQVVLNWTIHQPGITSALCGAKRPWQIEETAGAMGWELTHEQLAAIDAALAARGTPHTRPAV